MIEWLAGHHDRIGGLMCQNGIVPMLGKHAEKAARQFIGALADTT